MNLQKLSGFLAKTREALARFLSWWRGELLEAYDDWSMHRAVHQGAYGQINIGDSKVTLKRVLPQGKKVLADIPAPLTVDMVPGVRELLRDHGQNLRRVDILLSAELLLSRRVYLPMAVGGYLRQAVGYQLERLMPLREVFAYYDWVIVGRDELRRRLLVQISEVHREFADGLALEALKAGVGRVSILADLSPGLPTTARFLQKSAEKSTKEKQSINRYLGYLTSVLASAVVIVALIQYHAENDRLAVQIQSLKVRAGGAVTLREDLGVRVERIGILAERLRGIDQETTLAELTRLLPRDAWIFQFQADGNQLQISGFAKDASAVSSALSKSGLFRDVSLRSAMKAPGSDDEHFDITLHLAQAAKS